jgi:hypothetical protein
VKSVATSSVFYEFISYYVTCSKIGIFISAFWYILYIYCIVYVASCVAISLFSLLDIVFSIP